jgi:hypothetical protein
MRVWGTSSLRRSLGLILIAVAALAVVVLLLGPVTDLIASHDVGALAPSLRPAHLQGAREAARTQLLTLGAGMFAAAALTFTALNFRLSRQQFEESRQQFTEQLALSREAGQDSTEAQRKTLELTEQGQVTDRYTRAIQQLGSKKIDVRIGAIYALERIARDSARDHPTVIEVLSALIREHSHEQWPEAKDGADPPERETRPDVQAALTVIARRDPRQDARRVDLSRANLTRAILISEYRAPASLSRANLNGANLTRANFHGADLSGANLTDANVSGADLKYAKLGGADFSGADLSGADLSDASVRGADVMEADVTGADFSGADLNGADFSGTNVSSANFTEADLTRVEWPGDQPIPAGWEVDLARHRQYVVGDRHGRVSTRGFRRVSSHKSMRLKRTDLGNKRTGELARAWRWLHSWPGYADPVNGFSFSSRARAGTTCHTGLLPAGLCGWV